MTTPRPCSWRFVLLAACFEGGLALLAWGIAWLLNEPLWDRLKWDPADAALGLGACLPMLLLFWACLRSRLPPLVRIRRLCDEFVRPLFAPCTLAELALISLLAGLGEETLFRGVLQADLTRRVGLGPGIALASILFGLLHALTPTYAVLATLMGLYLGLVWVVADNLLVVILAHGVYDFVALIYLVRGPSPALPPDAPAPPSG
jgi:membrane protease YdiL (CAAX protease family)